MSVNPDQVEALIEEIAAEEISPLFGKLAPDQIETKSSPTDLVTVADQAAERALEKALNGLRPDATFIGEEKVAANPDLLANLGAEGAFWIVDPVDGTRNFVSGKPEFATIVALVENGETQMGWIHAIPDQKTMIAEKGGGAFWGGAKMSAIEEKSEGFVGYRHLSFLEEPLKSAMKMAFEKDVKSEPLRCGGYAYIRVARGERDFAQFSCAHPWDHAAGALAIAEIGGRTAYLDDETDYMPMPTVGRPLVFTGAQGNWRKVSDLLAPSPDG